MKQFLMNMNLSRKILIAPLVLIVFLIISGSVSYLGVSSLKSAIEEIFGTRFQSLQVSARIIKDITTVQANLYKTISWVNANYEAAKIDQLAQEQVKTLKEVMETLNKTAISGKLTEEERNKLKSVMTSLAAYTKDATDMLDMVSSDVNYATTYMAKADDKFQVLHGHLNELLDMETKLGQATYDRSLIRYHTSVVLFWVVLLAAIVLSVLISLMIVRAITGPFQKAMEVIEKISQGDLTQEIELTSADEIGRLVQLVDRMRQTMSEAVGSSVETSRTLADDASRQAASLEETSSSLEELSSMTKRNVDSTNRADRLMAGTKISVEKVNTSLSHLTTSMQEIGNAGIQTQNIVKTIDNISFQTNLLALNAAVEAARAGEAGAGFAVVANEVRNLASRAAEAAKNTSGMMNDIMTKIQKGEKLLEETNQEFAQMKTASIEVVNLMSTIAVASREQSSGIEQINKATQDMNETTQHNAACAEELASIMSVFVTKSNQEMITGG